MSIVLLILILVSALVGSLHPVLLRSIPFAAGAMLGNHLAMRRVVGYSFYYIFLILLAWWLFGVMMGNLFNLGPEVYFSLAIISGAAASVVGLFELANILWPRYFWMRPTPRITRLVNKHAHKIKRPRQILRFALWMLPTLFVYSSMLYIVTIGILRLPPSELWQLMLGYSLIVVLPLIIMTICIMRGIKVSIILQAIEKHSSLLRSITAAVLIIAGWTLLLQANTTINFG